MNSSLKIINGGSHANKTGSRLEKFVTNALEEYNYIEFFNHKEQVFENRKSVCGKQFAKQVIVGKTIYDTSRKCDFLVLNLTKFPNGLIIECKWQQSNGSVDEKYPFLLFNIHKTGIPTIVLLDGGGCKPGARIWLKAQTSMVSDLLGVWSMSEFQKEVNNGFLG
jgi:hypothetical protein